MQLRAATLNDLDQLLQLLKEANEKSYDEARERAFLIENLKNNKSDIFLAIDDKTQEIMGFIQTYRGRSTIFRNSYSYLTDLYVAKKYRELFIEPALLKYFEQIACQFGDARIELQTPINDHQRQKLFEDNRYLIDEYFTYRKFINNTPINSNKNPELGSSTSVDKITVRQATLNDLNELLPLLKAYLEFYHIPFDEKIDRDFLAENLKDNRSTIFVAVDNNEKIIGFTQLYRSRCTEYQADYYILYDLFINNNQRNKGVGALLLNAAEIFVSHQGLRYIELQTAHDNKAAQQLYKKHAYQLKDVTNYYKDLPKCTLNVSTSNTSLIVSLATQSQEQIWRDVQVTPKTLKYNMSWCWQITGAMNIDAFAYAWIQLVKSFPSLHTYFKYRDNKLFQIIDHQMTPQFEIKHLRDIDEEQIMQHILAKTRHCFDLAKSPLCLAYLFICTNKVYLGMTFHHMVLDGHSIPVLMKKFSEFYRRNTNSDSQLLATNTSLICEFVERERKLLLAFETSGARQFWLDYLTNVPRKINFQQDQATLTNNKSCYVSFNFSIDLAKQITDFAKKHTTTVFIIMSALFAMLLHRYSHQQQFVIGYPFGRRPEGFESLIGYHVNLLPLVISITTNKSYLEILEEIGKHRNVIKKNGYDHYPYLEIVKNLRLSPLNNSALFNVIISPTSSANLSISELNMNLVDVGSAENLSELILFYDTTEALQCGFEYSPKLFAEETIHKLIKDFEILVKHFMQHPEHSIDQIQLPLMSHAPQRGVKV